MSKIGGFASSMFALGDGASRVGSRWYFMNTILGALFFVKKYNIEETYKKRNKLWMEDHEKRMHEGNKCDCKNNEDIIARNKHRGSMTPARKSVAGNLAIL